MRVEKADVVVIGGGAAGLAAALGAKEAGAGRVLILERSEELGGVLFQCIHNGFGLIYFGEDLTGPEYAHRFIERVRELGVEYYLQTMVLELRPDKRVIAVNSEKGVFTVEAGAVVLAMGCRERTRGMLGIPGTRPAGIFTAGTAQRLINVEGFIPGRKVVILGSGDIGMIMARRFTLEGAEVKGVVEIMPYIGGLFRNEMLCLRDFGIPVYLKHTVTEIHGRDRVEAVTIAEVDDNRRPIPGTEKIIECDTLLLSVGLIPENELSIEAGIEIDPVTGGPFVNELMETSIPGIFACGNVVHVHDLVDDVSIEGVLAGRAAAAYAAEGKSLPRRIRVRPGCGVRYVVPQYISGERDVVFALRVLSPEDSVEIRIDGLLSRRMERVKPSESIKIKVSRDVLRNLVESGVREITVACVKIGKERPVRDGNASGVVREVVCLGCPSSCRIRLRVDDRGNIVEISGNRCLRGREWCLEELREPKRILTTTVRTLVPERPLLPVKTDKPIPLRLFRKIMRMLADVVVKPPVNVGDVIVSNILGTGANIVATSSLEPT